MPKHSSQILELAKLGAEHRYRALHEELAALVKHFPHLRTPSGMTALLTATNNERTAQSDVPTKRRRRRRLSAAQKKAISERMTRYWSQRRKASAKS